MQHTDRRCGLPPLLAIRLATFQIRLHSRLSTLERRYRPDQPRVPAGRREGGRWVREGGPASQAGRVRTALAAIYMFQQQVAHPVLGLARKCFYRDMLDRWFAVPMGIDKSCPRTYPADPTE